MQLFSNIIAPLIAGLFFLLYFIYFTISTPSRAASYRYFLIYLVGISLFSLGRPLQLLLGSHPVPLIIVNIRMIILCGLIAPVIIRASDLFNREQRQGLQIVLIAFCILLGLTYVVFNSLGTRESSVLFEFSVITARDNLTPSMLGPYYGREVTIAVQVLVGALLAVFSFIRLIQPESTRGQHSIFKNKIFLFNSGIFIFALSFIIGSLAKQWGIYYVASIMSALLFGGSVLIDIREVYHYYEKLIPFIKDDIIHNVAFSSISRAKLTEMLDCLGKKADLNTFVIIETIPGKTQNRQDPTLIDDFLKFCADQLRRILNEDCYILLPLSNTRIGIALLLPEKQSDDSNPDLLEVLEDIQIQVRKNMKLELSVGIGRSYSSLEDLRTSYHEALHALEYAGNPDSPGIVHATTLSTIDRPNSCYPVKEKEALLSLVKVGDRNNARQACSRFIREFCLFIEKKPDSLKVRLYEFIGSLIDTAILGGGDEVELNKRMEDFFGDISHVKDIDTVGKWLDSAVEEITAMVSQVYEGRSKSIIRKALAYMDENYSSQISYKDVAAEVMISPSYFLGLFKQETGDTFVDSLTMIRIEKAKHLLLTSDMNIGQIAHHTGFNNSNYFSRVFRKNVGLKATEYRMQAAQK